MATYGEPNYKFPTLARAVPNVTTGGTIMATVDLVKDLRKGCRCLYIAVEPSVAEDMTRRAEALIRRVERVTEIAHHHLDCSVCREILREIPSFFGMFFIDWHKAMWDDQANMRPW